MFKIVSTAASDIEFFLASYTVDFIKKLENRKILHLAISG
jgi:hypothetical protein